MALQLKDVLSINGHYTKSYTHLANQAVHTLEHQFNINIPAIKYSKEMVLLCEGYMHRTCIVLLMHMHLLYNKSLHTMPNCDNRVHKGIQ